MFRLRELHFVTSSGRVRPMIATLTRRTVLEGGLATLGLLALPLSARADAPALHPCVASGDPKQRHVRLWTRYLPADGGSRRAAGRGSRPRSEIPPAGELTFGHRPPGERSLRETVATGSGAGAGTSTASSLPTAASRQSAARGPCPRKGRGSIPHRGAVMREHGVRLLQPYRHLAQRNASTSSSISATTSTSGEPASTAWRRKP
jgi:hypothetical protein